MYKTPILWRKKTEEKFRPAKVTATIKRIMDDYFRDREYCYEEAKEWTSELTKEIRDACKELNMKRHKIMVQVVIGEQGSQGVRVVSKSLWDVNSDNWASYVFQNNSLFAVGMVFGCYYE